jgi:uncharacterized membrane protein YbhN (UPF0104 family)
LSVVVPPSVETRPSRRHRLLEITLWLVGLALFWLVLQLLGVSVKDWLDQLWDQVKAIPAGYTVGALVLQTGQTFFAGLSYYGILKAAYRDEVKLWQVVAAYSVGVAMNGFLPANIGTFVTLVMFIAIIPSCTLGGAVAAYLVQKIFFTLVGAFVYLYMFLSVPGALDANFGFVSSHQGLIVLIIVGAVLLLVVLGRIFWPRVKKEWAHVKKGGVILSTPRRYFSRVFLPSFLSYVCKLGVTAIFLAAFALPVTFESVMWVTGSGSLANVASATPGSVGVTQATNALALKTCCHVARSDAVDYSTAQQLVVTAWNQVVALVLVVWVFGWTGGKLLVTQSYASAKSEEQRRAAERKRKKAERKASRQDADDGERPE